VIVPPAFVGLPVRGVGGGPRGGFIRTGVFIVCRHRLRRRGRLAQRLPLLAGDVTGDLADGTAPAGELHDVLARLPLGQRTALVGRFYCGWDDDAIVGALGVRPATVRSLVHRGLAALRTELSS
jgi:DNA-directed RNA polymerase specialized sigma24 family protein